MSSSRAQIVVVDESSMRPSVYRPKIASYIRGLWRRRHFIVEEARGKQASANVDLLLGRIWNILNPLLDAAMYGVIFGLLLKTSKGIDNFIGYLVIGLIFFGFMSQGLRNGDMLLQKSRGMLNSFIFPRASLPIAVAVKALLENITPAVVALLFGIGFQLSQPVHISILAVVPIYILIHIFAAGLTLIVARITAFMPDIGALLKVVNRAWFYSSGVFFSVSRFAPNDTVRQILELNPAFQFLLAVRNSALYGEVPDLSHWCYMIVVSVLFFAIGLLFFWRAEARYGKI